jgi:4-diphosphocytidyl-2-C-methyl-D-erythritol kinase
VIRELAPAKVNLVLHVGARRDDGLHELCSLFASLDLADELEVEPAERDEVVCEGVEGPNLVSPALDEFRAAVPDAGLPPLRVAIKKRIPVAAGLGGGSADAAAALRAANSLSGSPLDANGLRRIAERVGADVPSQVEPSHWLVTGAGERLEPIELPPMTLVLVPAPEGLATGAVYAEADRIGATRETLDPDALRTRASLPLSRLAAGMENDLEPAALALRPELAGTLERLRSAGALAARITGSGPTAFGVLDSRDKAQQAARLFSEAVVTTLRQI